MNKIGNKEDIQQVLSVLGINGALDTLLCVRALGQATASEVAAEMGTHVATAVKRLTALHEIGLLDRRVRRGRTRSAQEYSLQSNRFGLDIDLDELADGISGGAGDSEIYLLLLKDIARRFAKFSGRSTDRVISGWGVQGILDAAEAGQEEILRAINDVLELETEEYGELTVKSLAATSVEAVGILDLENLPSKFFGVSK